jgi:protein required for attachment to host cells
MAKLKIGSGDWVVVCDGRKALILENEGDQEFPNLRMRQVCEHDDAPTHSQGADVPGRVHQSFGTARSAVEQTDWHDIAERHFLAEVVRQLDAALTNNLVKRFILIASPRALGMLRPVCSPALRHAISLEIDKDWVGLPIHEIEEKLLALIRHVQQPLSPR